MNLKKLEYRVRLRLNSLIKGVSSFLAVTLLSSCSNTPTVHLNKYYLENDATAAIVLQLENSGFNVEVNSVQFPEGLETTGVIYSPFVNDADAITKIEMTMGSLGYELESIDSLTLSNHWYKKNTIG